MRLKSLKLAGFKSFANPTTFTFRHGITAIVGPNGCGKSNVIDAIRWVLGESSAKQLRGGAMSDVIFAGTQNKAAKSLASVELTFEHTQDEQTGIRHELNLYHELSVRRQVNIEGKSDYFINGTRCRRRDVVDVFLGTGLGPRSYSVIGQGMIGRIVDANPQQLREFIEEAAGVSRYQARREETHKKLLKTQENLDRLGDIEAELTRQKKKLEKQAQSAKVYQEVQDELTQTKERLAVMQLQQAKAAEMTHQQAQSELASQAEQLQADNERIKQQLNKLGERMSLEQWLKDDARDKLHEQDIQRQKVVHELTSLETAISQLETRLQGNHDRQIHVHQEREQCLSQSKATAQDIARLTPKLAELQVKRAQMAGEYAPLQQQYETHRDTLTKLEGDKRSLEQALALNEQARRQKQGEQDKWTANAQAWLAEAVKCGLIDASSTSTPSQNQTSASISTLPSSNYWSDGLPDIPTVLPETNELDNTGNRLSAQGVADTGIKNPAIAKIDDELASISRQSEDIQDRLDDSQPKLMQLSQSLTSKQDKLTHTEKQHARLLAEYETLHAIVYPKPKQSVAQTSSQKTTSTEDDEESFNQPTQVIQSNQISNISPFADLPTLADSIKLTDAGKTYAEILDKWLSLWLDSRIMMHTLDPASEKVKASINSDMLAYLMTEQSTDEITATGNKNDAKGNKRTKQISQANSVFFGIQGQQNGVLEGTTSLSKSLKPLAELIASPKLAIFQQCYLYLPDTDISADANVKVDVNVTDGVQATEQLQEMLAKLPAGSMLLTQSGWLISHVGAVHLSKLDGVSENTQFLSLRLQQEQRLGELEKALNEVEEEIDALSRDVKTIKMSHEQLNVDYEESLGQLTALTHRRHDLQTQRTQLVAEYRQQQAEQTRLAQRRAQLADERDDLITAMQQLDDEHHQIKDKLSQMLPQLTDAQSKQQALETQRHTLDQQERKANQAYSETQLALNKAELALQHSREQTSKLDAELARLGQTQAKLEKEQATAEAKRPKIIEAMKQATHSWRDLQVEFDERQSVINTLNHDIQSAQAQRDAGDRALTQLQAKLAESRTQVAIANERINEASERLTALGSQVAPSTILADFIAHAVPISDDKIQQLQTREQALSVQLQGMGAVNLAAAAEMAAVEERLEPLTQQVEDIRASMAKLTDAITSIDTKTKVLFLQTLDAVNESLASLFTKVFGGGQAALTLIKDDSLSKSEQWRAGLELMAQPRGKKNSRLAVLSGGEKTLTALSLIFAIFKQHPAPFCLLDEVDAPLDDANVGRFTNLIRELAGDVQFIFISHNKLAMQIADELKGITMPQAGISSLVSVSLEEAEQYLEPST